MFTASAVQINTSNLSAVLQCLKFFRLQEIGNAQPEKDFLNMYPERMSSCCHTLPIYSTILPELRTTGLVP
jgi:hypothetical protein